LFGNNLHNETVPAVSSTGFSPAYWVAGMNGPLKYVFKTAIYNSTENVGFNVTFEGIAAGVKGNLTVLSAPSGLSSNVLNAEDGTGVSVTVTEKRVQELTASEGGVFGFELANYEVGVLTT
jgi:alpha-N-arabinofuranosidase